MKLRQRDFLLYMPTRHGEMAASPWGENRIYDVALNDYTGDGVGIERANYRFAIAGHKWPGICEALPQLPTHYKAVAFLDDDIEVSTDQLNQLFTIGNAAGLDLWQASLSIDGVCGWQHLNHRDGGIGRCVPMVEIMMPVFSRHALEVCRLTFGEVQSGYGLDFLWPKLLRAEGVAVIDAVTVKHTRPINSASWVMPNGKLPRQEWYELSQRYELVDEKQLTWDPNPKAAKETAPVPTILIGMPHAHNPHPLSSQRLWMARSRRANVLPMSHSTSALARNFNIIWSTALTARDKGEITHFAMLHDDVVPVADWVDILLDELEAHDADLISSVIAIKDDRGCTSTGIDDPTNPWNPAKRITTTELQKLPETFSAADCGWPERALLVNTGCWLADLRRPVFHSNEPVFPLFFTMHDRIARTPGAYHTHFEPEDWFFGRELHKLGAKVVATRKTKCLHYGMVPFPVDHAWGLWEEDQAGTIAELRQLAAAASAGEGE